MNWKLLAIVGVAALAAACTKPATESAATSEAAVAVPTVAPVAGGAYVLDPDHSSLRWSIKHLGLSNYVASFEEFTADVTVDKENPGASSVKFSVVPGSVHTDYSGNYKASHKDSPFASWNEQITKGFLGSDKSPAFTFTSTAFALTGEKNGTVTGDLTLNGVTKPVTLTVELVGSADAHPFTQTPGLGLHAHGTVKRSDFGVATEGPLNNFLSDEVEISFDGEFVQPSAPAPAPAAAQ